MNHACLRTFETGVVVLAAGRSSRMGRPKLLLPWGGTSVLGHLIAQWSNLGARQLAVVCSPHDERIAAELDRLGFPAANRIFNPAPERGMFSSIQCASSWGGWQSTLALYAVVLGDQPHLRPETLRRILEFAGAHPDLVCQPAWAQRARHPVIMPRGSFFKVAGSACATLKDFLAPLEVALCEVDDPGLDLDIDRPEDYRRALRISGYFTSQ